MLKKIIDRARKSTPKKPTSKKSTGKPMSKKPTPPSATTPRPVKPKTPRPVMPKNPGKPKPKNPVRPLPTPPTNPFSGIKDTVGSTPRGPRGPIAPPVNKGPSKGPVGKGRLGSAAAADAKAKAKNKAKEATQRRASAETDRKKPIARPVKPKTPRSVPLPVKPPERGTTDDSGMIDTRPVKPKTPRSVPLPVKPVEGLGRDIRDEGVRILSSSPSPRKDTVNTPSKPFASGPAANVTKPFSGVKDTVNTPSKPFASGPAANVTKPMLPPTSMKKGGMARGKHKMPNGTMMKDSEHKMKSGGSMKMKSGGKVRGYGMARGGKACKMS